MELQKHFFFAVARFWVLAGDQDPPTLQENRLAIEQKMNLYLQVTLPDREPETRDFGNVSQLVIGRSEQCDFSLSTINDLSRQHAKLEVIAGRWHVSDLGSKFGTYVNESKIEQPTVVSPADVVRLGGHVRLRVFEEPNFQEPSKHSPSQNSAEAIGSVAPAPPLSAPAGQLAGNVAAPSIAKAPIVIKSDDTGARPWHIGLGVFTAVVSASLLFWYLGFTVDQPKRGYTFLGMTTGVVGTMILCLVGFYAARKRVLQELIPWRLLTWLRWHLWLSVIGFWMILIHAGFHLDGGSGTWAMLLLLAAVGTGVVGWYQYKKVPGEVVSTVGNLATGNVRKQIDGLDRQISDQLAGRDTNIVSRVRNALTEVDSGERTAAEISWDLVFENPQGEPFVDDVKALVQQKYSLASHLNQQQTLHKSMRWWLWLHIPASILFGVLLAYHIYDAVEIGYITGINTAGPHEFADPGSCKDCHQAQYDDWIGSVHAMAMSSPVTELQNYLVVKKDRFDQGRHGVVVGQLCIECHAPTSVKGGFWEKEDLLATIDQRAPSSQFGVSCVACHQVKNIKKTAPFAEAERLKDEEPKLEEVLVDYKNFENLEYVNGGRTMFGTVDNDHQAGGGMVGNSAHNGQFATHMKDSSFCASCHTVMVDPVGEGADEKSNIVTLQNTYHEWKEGSDKPNPKNDSKDSIFETVNWAARDVSCLDCHGKPLEGLVAAAENFQDRRTSLRTRVREFVDLVKENADAPLSGKYKRFAADSNQNFDHPLEHRPTHLHTFVGVDYHLEPDMPYPKGHPRNSENPRIQAQTIENITELMKIAAAVKIDKDQIQSNSIEVEVANLATGHHLPAGFAFAREMWLEVAVKKKGSRNFEVVVGGSPNRAGQPLGDTEKLDKYGEGASGKLKNFQAVLWNGDEGRVRNGVRHGETVLQNECKVVLKGKKARDHGFEDRQLFLKPGEIRTLRINVDRSDLKSAKEIRVRLRFRNYPPEFLEQLADRFRHNKNRYTTASSNVTRELHTSRNYVQNEGVSKNGDGFASDPEMWERDDERANRTERLIERLRIFEMAEDTVDLTKSY
jgi:hypothetical protein